MLSFKQLVCINGKVEPLNVFPSNMFSPSNANVGLILVCYMIFAHQAAATPVPYEQASLDKRRIDSHARTSIPLFRGSNLGIFVRKRPYAMVAEHSMVRRKDDQSSSAPEESLLADLYNSEVHQRRFDDYADNPGPMFGR